MPSLKGDPALWYNVGIFGEAGYAVPNWSNDVGSNNPQILDWVDLVGQNLFTIMHHEDVDLRTPPSINTLMRIHKLYLRAAAKLAGNAIPPGQPNMEIAHTRPAGEVYRVYPVPYFKARNPFLRRWCGYILMMLAESMQHTENRKSVEISTAFAGQVGQYIKRVYVNMAIELFQKDKATAEADQFVLTDADFTAYDPGKFFTSTEMVDTVARLDRIFTEDRLEFLREGIPVTQLPKTVCPWPTDLQTYYEQTREDATIGADGFASASAGETSIESGSSGAQKVAIIPPPPGP
ncbi:MAG: hypothetical protein AB7I57_22890 [Pirellulales bacterium]